MDSAESLGKKLELVGQLRRCFTSLSKAPEWKVVLTHLLEFFGPMPAGNQDSLTYARHCGRQDIIQLLIKNTYFSREESSNG
jgi:hypothetical protein